MLFESFRSFNLVSSLVYNNPKLLFNLTRITHGDGSSPRQNRIQKPTIILHTILQTAHHLPSWHPHSQLRKNLLHPDGKTRYILLQKSSHTLIHMKKFQVLLDEYKAPFSSPFDSLDESCFSTLTFHGPLPSTSPSNKYSTATKTVVNLSSVKLSSTQLQVLDPNSTKDPTPDLAPLIQNTLKSLPEGMELSATHQVVEALSSYDHKTDKTPTTWTTNRELP